MVVFYFAASSEVAWLFLLAYLIAALVVASFAYALWNRGIHGELAVSGAIPNPGSPREDLPGYILDAGPLPEPIFEGDRIDLVLRLSARGGARGPARIVGTVAGAAVSGATGLVTRAGWTDHRIIGPLRRGPLGTATWIVESGDLLGLFRHRRKLERPDFALVLPRLKSLSATPHTRELEASVAAPRAGIGSELFGVREYRAGDALRRIHWPSSARHAELMVREHEPPGVQVVGIICDPEPPSIDVADQVARLAASEAWDCIRGGGRVVLWSPGCQPTGPAESRSLWALLEWLATYPRPSDVDEDLPRISDVIAVMAGADRRVIDVLDEVRLRGGSARAWIVGDAKPDLDVPVEHAGLGWPL